MCKDLGISYHDIARITGNSYDSIKTVMSRDDIPRWAKLAVWIYEKYKSEDGSN